MRDCENEAVKQALSDAAEDRSHALSLTDKAAQVAELDSALRNLMRELQRIIKLSVDTWNKEKRRRATRPRVVTFPDNR
jgi:hypothetical protein